MLSTRAELLYFSTLSKGNAVILHYQRLCQCAAT